MTPSDPISSQFWQQKRLSQMTEQEWESLCDGCGRCCLHKLEDEDSGEIFYTRAACELLDISRCQCTDYSHRQQRVPGCLKLSVENSHQFDYLPTTCAYRLLAEGESLPEWHPLISGDPDSVARAGISVTKIAKPIALLGDLRDEIILLSESS